MKHLLTILSLCICATTCFTQTDSLLAALARSKEDTARVRLLRNLGWKYMIRDADSSFMFYQQSLELAQKIQDQRGEILGLLNIVAAQNRRGDNSQSIQLMHEALRIATDLGDYTFMALCHGRLASYYSKDTHRPDSALMHFALTEEYNIKSGNTYVNWETYLFRGELYYSLGMYDKGEADLLRALALTREGSNRIDRGMVLHRLVRTFFDLKAWEKYSKYSEEYISFLSDGKSGMNINNATHRVLYFFEDDAEPEKAIPVVKNIAQIHESMQHRLSAIDAWKFLSTLQEKSGRLNDAVTSLERAADLAAQFNYLAEQEDCYYKLYLLSEKTQQQAHAFNYFKKYKAIQDSVEILDNRKLFSELEVKYETQKKDEALALQQFEIEKQELTQRNLILLICLLSLIALATLGFLYFKWRSNRLLKEKNAFIASALNEKELLLREIHHRVKNNLQVISSLLNLQSKYVDDQKAAEAIKDGRNRVNSMSLIHQNLYLNENLATINVGRYLEKLSESLFQSYNIDPERIKLEVQVDQSELDVDTLIPLGLIINELLSNALKHAFPSSRQGKVTVRFQNSDEHFFLEVSDNGIGMDAQSLSDMSDTFGIEMIQAFVQKLKASIRFESRQGVTVSLKIPKQAA